MRFWLVAVISFALVSVSTHAEDNCGSMLRTMSRFRGTVRSVETLATSTAAAMPVDLDPRFVVGIDVDSVAAPAMGKHLLLAIHSPSRTFGTGRVVGRTFDFDAERMDCDGQFRRLLTLQQHAANRSAEAYDGELEVGHTYRAKANRVSGDLLTLVPRPHLPMHHDGGIAWTNADAFAGHAAHEVVFEVVSREITQTAERGWLSIFNAKIVEL